MTMHPNTPLKVTPRGSHNAAAIEALASAVTSEVRLLEDLIGIMRRQRTAVSTDDLEGVDDSVYATHRVLVTLAEARRRRRSLNQLVGGTEELPLKGLDDVLGERMSDELRFARDGLHAAALTLAREVEVNRQILREALAAGNDYVRTVYGIPEAKMLYTEPGQGDAGGAKGGILLDRTG